MNVVDLRLLVEEGPTKAEEHRLQEAHRLWPLGSSMAVRTVYGHLITRLSRSMCDETQNEGMQVYGFLDDLMDKLKCG